MSDFIFAFNCIAPLFIIVLLGVAARSLGWVKDVHMPALNKLCYNLFIPCLLVKSCSEADFSQIFGGWLYIYGLVTLVLSFVLMIIITPRFIKDPARAAAFAHCCGRANTMLIGVPVTINLLGETQAFPVIIMLLLIIPVSNAMAVITMSLLVNKGHKLNLPHLAKEVLCNPVIISIALGMLFFRFDVNLPQALDSVVSSLAAATSPVAMICIGARFQIKRMASEMSLVCWAAAIKLLIFPLLFVLPLLLLGVRGLPIVTIFMAHAAPSAATAGILTEVMGGDVQLANEITLLSTAFSAITLFLAAVVFRAAGMV